MLHQVHSDAARAAPGPVRAPPPAAGRGTLHLGGPAQRLRYPWGGACGQPQPDGAGRSAPEVAGGLLWTRSKSPGEGWQVAQRAGSVLIPMQHFTDPCLSWTVMRWLSLCGLWFLFELRKSVIHWRCLNDEWGNKLGRGCCCHLNPLHLGVCDLIII